jgi:hypothetical protein
MATAYVPCNCAMKDSDYARSFPWQHRPECIRRVTHEQIRAKGLCPTCYVVPLTNRERAKGYQCRNCADTEEGAF